MCVCVFVFVFVFGGIASARFRVRGNRKIGTEPSNGQMQHATPVFDRGVTTFATQTNFLISYPAKSIRRGEILDRCGNDPSAGSPTETLLRLHLPLNHKV